TLWYERTKKRILYGYSSDRSNRVIETAGKYVIISIGLFYIYHTTCLGACVSRDTSTPNQPTSQSGTTNQRLMEGYHYPPGGGTTGLWHNPPVFRL
ncbi:hypothetical protein T310_9882, partial [Rasamsonia emersonii CBS 393.64]